MHKGNSKKGSKVWFITGTSRGFRPDAPETGNRKY